MGRTAAAFVTGRFRKVEEVEFVVGEAEEGSVMLEVAAR